ncbi:transcriptional regulator [Paenibacillus swuensis]|uniref:Transcriptional regulator n=1 Tax=Paenibacillus swuensis TaxID=1178515 RepID=A0A172TH59_9BACL|nr:YafY family protein [Paenibacillus swuensis]ANE46123.1 transcriptional regulator [Paenibacillus swuensis]
MKLERLISMIYMLLNNEVLSASVLAEKYGVSQRTIYRDIDAICAAGIPVVSYQGVHGGYGIMEEYKMDRSLLGSYDVGSLVTLLHSMSTVFEDDKAMETMQRLQTIQPDHAPTTLTMDMGSRQTHQDQLKRLRDAIHDRNVLQFQYMNTKNERTKRAVEGIRLMFKHGTWYLYGYCRERKDYREFRLSRIAELNVTTTLFGPHAITEANPRQASARPLADASEKVQVVVRFTDLLARAMDYFGHLDTIAYDEEGALRITLNIPRSLEAEWLYSILLSFGNKAEIMEPVEVRSRMKSHIEAMLGTYS